VQPGVVVVGACQVNAYEPSIDGQSEQGRESVQAAPSAMAAVKMHERMRETLLQRPRSRAIRVRRMTPLPPKIEQLLRASSAGQSVVFDADGTLWRGDVGEDFLRFLSARGALLSPPAEGAYAKYDRLHHEDPPRAYAYAVTVMAGLLDSELTALASEFFTSRFTGRIFPYVRPLLARLAEQQLEVWVCSASPRWVVDAGAAALGLEARRVIAVDAELDEQGRLTDRVIAPVAAGPGKVAWLKRKNVAPVLAVGNGDLDLDMLSYAGQGWVIAPPDAAPSALVREAIRRDWPISRL